MRSVKVVIASRLFAPEPAAASFRLQALARSMASKGANVCVLTTEVPPQFPQTGAEKGLDIRRVPVLRDNDGYVRGYIQYLSFDIPLFFRLMTIKRPDVIICEPPPTTGFMTRCAAGIRRIPYVYYAADVWSDAASSTGASTPVVFALRMIEKFALRGARSVIAVSDDVRDRVQALGAKNIKVAFNGVNTSVFNLDVEPLSADELLSEGIDRPYFVYAGNASEWHGAEIFARAFEKRWARDRSAQLVFLGRIAVPEIQQIADRMRYRAQEGNERPPIVILRNQVPERAARWQRGAIAALASVRPGAGYDFAYATKVLSALSCGTPVIYSGVGLAGADIKENKLGAVTEYTDDAVMKALQRVFISREDYEEKRLSEWVSDNRSIEKTGDAAARIVLSVFKNISGA